MGARRSLAAAVVVLAAAACVPAAGAAPPGGSDWQTIARGTLVADATMLPLAGKDLLFATHTLAPGASTGWYDGPGAVAFVVPHGTLTLLEGSDCRAQTIEAGQAVAVQPGKYLLRNGGDGTLVVAAGYVSLPVGGPTPFAENAENGPACAAETGTSTVEVLARGTFTAHQDHSDRFDGDGTRPMNLQKGLDITVDRLTFGPKFVQGTWQNSPGPALGVVTKGYGRWFEAHDGKCEAVQVKTGDGLVSFPERPYWFTNDSATEDQEFITGFVNVPKGAYVPDTETDLDNTTVFAPPDGCPVPAEAFLPGH
jgi:hypothetical protein